MELKKDPKFDEFFDEIKDELTKGKINARITRLMLGNPGNSESVGDGVLELKIDFGPGWRVYYIKVGNQIIVLLGGGTKKKSTSRHRCRQRACSKIQKLACENGRGRNPPANSSRSNR